MSAANNRIEWVDIAKGMAILWVVALHIGLFGAGSKFEDFVFTTWCMPFFFTISGLFLSHSDDFGTFFKRRVNNLLVPLCFFVFLTNALFWVAGDLLGGTEKGWIQQPFHWVSTLQFCW
ncbi:MAG: acyltransferase family protein, partial [Bacteroidales bacterium]|nr:acyltransferase family protein [Bacteroidales bacterium]